MTDQTLGFVHRWVANGSLDAPTILALHGTGGDENDLLPLCARVAPGMNVLSPRGKVVEMGAPRFFRRLAEGVFDVDDLVARSHELADFVQAAAQEYGFAADSVLALGYSNGANIAASVLFLRPEVLRGGALLRAMSPFGAERMPGGAPPDLSAKRVWLSAGESDRVIPAASTALLVDQLRSAGASVTVARQRAGHELVMGDLEGAAAFLASAKHGRD